MDDDSGCSDDKPQRGGVREKPSTDEQSGPSAGTSTQDDNNDNAKRLKTDPTLVLNGLMMDTVGSPETVTDEDAAESEQRHGESLVSNGSEDGNLTGTDGGGDHLESSGNGEDEHDGSSGSSIEWDSPMLRGTEFDIINMLNEDGDDAESSTDGVDGDEDNEDRVLPKAEEILNKTVPKHKWFIVPEILNRQLGCTQRKQEPSLFQRRCYGSLHFVRRLELMYKLDDHRGCVNCLNFHPNGQYLASGSDDTRVVIWDWANGRPLTKFESKHRNNVFQSKFLNMSGDMHIVTAGRDGQVRLAQVGSTGLRSSRKLGTHRSAVHKVASVTDQPHLVLSAGEDGVVMRHDLRVHRPSKILTVRPSGKGYIQLYSIHCNPAVQDEFCIAGCHSSVLTFDHRKCSNSKPLMVYNPFNNPKVRRNITNAVYNHNGTEILASYGDDDIYLFDVKNANDYLHRYQGHRNSVTIKGVNFFGPKSEYIVSGSDCGHVYFWDRNTEAIVNCLRADDEGVVNCLEPHPQLPFICTSGLDWNVKVWVPSCEKDPDMTDLKKIILENIKDRGQPNTEDNILWYLWSHMINRETENLSDSSSSSDAETNHSRRRGHNQEGPTAGCAPS